MLRYNHLTITNKFNLKLLIFIYAEYLCNIIDKYWYEIITLRISIKALFLL